MPLIDNRESVRALLSYVVSFATDIAYYNIRCPL